MAVQTFLDLHGGLDGYGGGEEDGQHAIAGGLYDLTDAVAGDDLFHELIVLMT